MLLLLNYREHIASFTIYKAPEEDITIALQFPEKTWPQRKPIQMWKMTRKPWSHFKGFIACPDQFLLILVTDFVKGWVGAPRPIGNWP